MRASRFAVRTPGQEARAILAERRVKGLQDRVEAIRRRSWWLRRLLCLVSGHRPWATGLAGQAKDGKVYALTVCERCGRRWASEQP